MEDIKVLQKLPLFHTLDRMDLIEVGKCVRSKHFSAGEAIIAQGDTSGGFYILKTGRATVHYILDQQKKVLGHFDPGDSFGEVSLIDEGPRSATVEAEMDSNCLYLKREDFQHLLDRGNALSQKLLYNLLKNLCDKLRRTNHYLVLAE